MRSAISVRRSEASIHSRISQLFVFYLMHYEYDMLSEFSSGLWYLLVDRLLLLPLHVVGIFKAARHEYAFS